MSGICPIGSCKGNFGHLADGAAGVVGLITVLLAMAHRQIPPTVHFKTPNSFIDWTASPIYCNQRLSPWTRKAGKPFLAGVSAFGLLGTNVHCVVEEWRGAGLPRQSIVQNPCQLNGIQPAFPFFFVLGARTESALLATLSGVCRFIVDKIAQFSADADSVSYLHHLCFSLNKGRSLERSENRVLCHGNTSSDLLAGIEAAIEELQSRTSINTAACGRSHAQILREIDGLRKPRGFCLFSGVQNEEDDGNTTEPAMTVEDAISAVLYSAALPVDWYKVYSPLSTPMVQIPMLPTYVFDRIRVWPEHKTPSDLTSLQLETITRSAHNPKHHPLVVEPNEVDESADPVPNHTDKPCIPVTDAGDQQVSSNQEHIARDELLRSSRPVFDHDAFLQDVQSAVAAALNSILNQATDVDWTVEHNQVKDLGSFQDSLQLTWVLRALENQFKVELPLTALQAQGCNFAGLVGLVIHASHRNDRTSPSAPKPQATVEDRSRSARAPSAAKDSDSRVLISPAETAKSAPKYKEQKSLASPAERRLWVAQQVDASGVAYNVGNGLLIEGYLDVAQFTQAANSTFAKHPVLKSTFRQLDGQLWHDTQGAVAVVSVVDRNQALAELGENKSGTF